jgi:hypothetical protein
MKKTLISALILTAVGCTDAAAPPAPEESAGCEDGKCDGPSSPPSACSLQAPPPGTYALTNAPAAIQQLFDRWLAKAAETDSYVRMYRYFNGQQIKLEKLIRHDGNRVVFQAAIAIPPQYSCAAPLVTSWVVVFDGTSFRWVEGRHEFSVGTSELVNLSAASTDVCHYGDAFDPSQFELLSATGTQIAKWYFPSNVSFRRVSGDVVLASGQDAAGWQIGHTLSLSGPAVTTVVRPTGFTPFASLGRPCAGTLF